MIRSNIVGLTPRRFFSLIVLLTLLSGCNDNAHPIVWNQELQSPDGEWTAVATTRQWGGFGSAWIETTIALRSTSSKFVVNEGKPFDVFSYPDGSVRKAYTLSPENKDAGLLVRWISPKHLEIGHSPLVEPDLAVVRWSSIDIIYVSGTY